MFGLVLIFPSRGKNSSESTLLNAQSIIRFSNLPEGAGWGDQALFLSLREPGAFTSNPFEGFFPQSWTVSLVLS